MGLYRQRGSKVWWMSLSYDGFRVRESTETTDKRLAEAILAKAKTRLVEGKWFEVDQSKVRTLAELTGKYLEERSKRKSPASYGRDISCFKHVRGFFGDCKLAEITPNRLSCYREERLKSADPQTVVKELSVLRNAFNVAIKEWEWCKENPVSRISMPKIPQGRLRYLTAAEIARLFEHAEDWFKPVLTTAVHTGMRQGNLISLTWDKVDLFGRVIILDKTKNGERLAIPMNDTLFEILKELRKRKPSDSDLVFQGNGKAVYQVQLNRALKRACRLAGIEDFRFHDLRHTFVSLLINDGVDLYTLQRLLGQKDGRMTQRYAHLTHERLASAVKGLDRMCHSLVIVGDEKGAAVSATP